MMVKIAHRPTAAFIDLDALARNFHSTKQFVGAELMYMAVVKANAYGHGAAACALRLQDEGVDWFGVATPEEAIEIREAGIVRPILCLGSIWPGQEPLIFDHGLTPVVYDLDVAVSLNNAAANQKVTLDVHVKIDTGMGRVGVRHSQIDAFVKSISQLENLKIAGLLTHFAAAENPSEDEFTNLQIKRFDEACDIFRDAGHKPVWFDLANSPAAFRHPSSRGNMVRIGGALFGLLDDILPPETVRPSLEPVLSLRSRIVHVKQIPCGESVGYGRAFITRRDSAIALLPIGYADGYLRSFADRVTAKIGGITVPVVGRISMDWTLFDVTDVPEAKTGDEVILIGNGVTAIDIAKKTGTIAYEITCGLSQRVPRIYE